VTRLRTTPLAGIRDPDLQRELRAHARLVNQSSESQIVGPASSVDLNLVAFDGTDGKAIQDAGVAVAGLVPVTRTINGQPLSANVTLTAADVGADASGAAAAAVAAHAALPDPHPGYLTPAEGNAAYQPLDATLTALAAADWAANAIPVGTGADALSQVALAANTFLARSSAGNVAAKAITDNILTFLATPSSANLAAAVTDESGTGALLFAGGNIGAATGTSLAVTGALTSAGGVIGHVASVGAGGAVTQLVSKSEPVTLDKRCGTITMHNAALAAATIVSFTLNNSTIDFADLLVCTHSSGGTIGAYTINGRPTSVGAAQITIRNNTAGALSEALTIKFFILKAPAS
jgi:hypothetical protein